MRPEGAGDALRRLWEALVPGGWLVDTQPVSAAPIVEGRDGHFGTLDMREWVRTVAAVDRLLAETVAEGRYTLVDERRFTVTDEFADGSELVEEARGWVGTTVPEVTMRGLAEASGPVRLHQLVRMRLLRAQAVTAPE